MHSYCYAKFTDSIATDKRGYPHNIFLTSRQKHMLLYSLEAPRWGASNEYPQHMFLLRNKKDISIFRMKKAPYLLFWPTQNWSGSSLSAIQPSMYRYRIYLIYSYTLTGFIHVREMSGKFNFFQGLGIGRELCDLSAASDQELCCLNFYKT